MKDILNSRAIICALVALISAVGCGEPKDPEVDTDNPFVKDKSDPRLQDPDGDADEDGLSNSQELRGWEVIVNATGYAELTDIYTVYSDPLTADTDGDGLADKDEFMLRTNPMTADTDGDGLSDQEEHTRWGTSPVSVDTDGDARGTRGESNVSPWSRLFDGAELDLQIDPENPTGPLMAGPRATAPHLVDTDGDNVSDYDELLDPKRNPSVAELPVVEISPTPGATIELAFNTVLTSSNSSSEQHGVQLDMAQSFSMTQTTSLISTTMVEYEEWASIMLLGKVGCCSEVGTLDAEGKVGAKLGLKSELTLTSTFELEAAAQTRTAYDLTMSEVESETIVITGGTIRLSVDVVNTSALPVRVSDLAVLVTYSKRAPKGMKLATLTELVPESFQSELVLLPGERQSVIMSNESIPVGPMEELMADPRSITLALSRYTMSDESGDDYDFIYPNVRSRCATVVISTPTGSQQFYVAADVGRKPDGSRVGTSLGAALAAVGIDFEAIPIDKDAAEGTDGYYIRIGDEETILHEGQAPSLQANGADAMGYPISGGPGKRITRAGFAGLVERPEDVSERPVFATDFFSFMLMPGDLVTIIRIEDNDRDGLPNLEEAFYGSSDYQVHSDATPDKPIGDGLSDFFEVREGWRVTPTNGVTYRVYSNPFLLDSDGDGLRDDEEVGWMVGVPTDPIEPDTDFDGYNDLIERVNSSGTLNPVRPDERTAPAATCTYVMDQGSFNRTYTVTVSDAAGDINRVLLDVGDGSPNQVRTYTPNDPQPTTLTFSGVPLIHQTVSLARVFVRDQTGDQTMARCEQTN